MKNYHHFYEHYDDEIRKVESILSEPVHQTEGFFTPIISKY